MNLRTLMTVIGARGRFARLAGITYEGLRDVFKALGYKKALLWEDYYARFLRNEVANRIVKALPNATWRGGAEVWDDQDPNVDTAFEQAFEALDRRLHIWDVFRRADILARIGEYAVILIGAPGELETPLTALASPDDIAYLQPYSQRDATVERYVTDTKDPRFGSPEFYNIKRTMFKNPDALNTSSVGRRVHWTRVWPISDGLLDDRMLGEPALQCVWNRLDDLDKVAGGGAEAFWKRADGGINWNIEDQTAADLDEPAKQDFEKQLEEYEHGWRRYILSRGLTANRLGSDVADFNSPVLSIISLICAGTGIPQRVLLGSEQGKLAAKTDRGNWDDRVSDRREAYADAVVARPFIENLIKLGALPEPDNDDWEVRFPELKVLDDDQKADVAVKWASLNKPGMDPVVDPDEIRTRVLGLESWEAVNGPRPDVQPVEPAQPLNKKKPQALESQRWAHVHAAADRFPRADASARQRELFRRSQGYRPESARRRVARQEREEDL